MATSTFSGSSAYQLEATASRSGSTVSVTVKVKKLSGTGYWTNTAQDWSVTIGGKTQSDDWTYDFRDYSSKTLGTKSRSGLAPGTYSWSVTVEMDSGIGSATVSGSITIPPDAPSAPTIGTPVRVSDTTQTVAWTRNASSSAPYTSQQVQRATRTTSWRATVGIGTIGTDYTSSGSHSYTDSGTVANRVYRYKIKASNSAGSAYSEPSVLVFTTPGAPSSLSAVKNAAGGVDLTLAQTVLHEEYVTEIEYSTDGGSSWTDLTELAAGVLTYIWVSPPTGDPLKFRARVRIDYSSGVGHGLTSAWRTSNTVELEAPPDPPSALSPNGTVIDGDEAVTLTWQHNPIDSSPQSAYEVRYRESGASTWTEPGAVASTVSEAVLAAATLTNGVVYEWQVRTWGAHDDPSDWSATATVTASTPPTVTITTPDGSTLAASQVTAVWSYYDAESTTQSAWEAELSVSGTVLEQRSGSGGATSVVFTTQLADATSYMVRVRVRDGSGLWSAWDQVVFTADFPPAPTPVVTLAWDEEQGAVQVGIENPEPSSSEVAATFNQVFRSVDGESWTLVTGSAGVGTVTADPEAPVGVEVFYRVVAWSDLPSASVPVVVSVTTSDECGFWSAGDGFARVVRMVGGHGEAPRVDFTQGLYARTLHYFAGRVLPVETSGEQRARTGKVTFMTLSRDDLSMVRELAYLPAPHLVRIPDGTVVYGSVGDVSESRVVGDYFEVSFTVTEVDH